MPRRSQVQISPHTPACVHGSQPEFMVIVSGGFVYFAANRRSQCAVSYTPRATPALHGATWYGTPQPRPAPADPSTQSTPIFWQAPSHHKRQATRALGGSRARWWVGAPHVTCAAARGTPELWWLRWPTLSMHGCSVPGSAAAPCRVTRSCRAVGRPPAALPAVTSLWVAHGRAVRVASSRHVAAVARFRQLADFVRLVKGVAVGLVA